MVNDYTLMFLCQFFQKRTTFGTSSLLSWMAKHLQKKSTVKGKNLLLEFAPLGANFFL